MSFTSILILLLLVGYGMYTKASKAAARQLQPEEGPETLGDENEYFDDEEPVEEEEPYFSYETETDSPTKEAPVATPVAQPVAAFAESDLRPQFDLRQAIISQVILNNRYIAESNQQNQ